MEPTQVGLWGLSNPLVLPHRQRVPGLSEPAGWHPLCPTSRGRSGTCWWRNDSYSFFTLLGPLWARPLVVPESSGRSRPLLELPGPLCPQRQEAGVSPPLHTLTLTPTFWQVPVLQLTRPGWSARMDGSQDRRTKRRGEKRRSAVPQGRVHPDVSAGASLPSAVAGETNPPFSGCSEEKRKDTDAAAGTWWVQITGVSRPRFLPRELGCGCGDCRNAWETLSETR